MKKKYQKTDFSVLMAVYHKDDPCLLNNAIESIYSNTIQPEAVILVQDGPIGEKLSRVVNFYEKQKNLHLVKLETNQGLAVALNFGLARIKTTYVFRADADDYNLPDRFERQLVALKSGYDLVGGK